MSADRPRGSRAHPDRQPGPVVRKDADGQRSIGSTWESVTERIIREAQERGDFDDLPGHGRPIRVEDNPYAGDMALAYHLLRNAGVAPPWIETDKEARRLRDAFDALLVRAVRAPLPIRATLRRQVEQVVADHDATVRRLNSEAPSVRNHRSPIGRDAALTALDAAIRGDRPQAAEHPRASPDARDTRDADP